MLFVVSSVTESFRAEIHFALDGQSFNSVAIGKHKKTNEGKTNEGHVAESDGVTLHTWTVGSLPIVNRILEEMRLEEMLQTHRARDGPRMKIPT